MDSEYVIEMLNIRKEFPGIVANDDITLQLKRGEIHALLGENGAGKSTFSKLLAGILKPSDGKICVNGIDTKKAKNSMLAKTTGFLFQNPDRQLCTYTVRDEIAFGQKALKTGTEEEISKRTEKIIERFGFNPDEAPFSLSRGQRQRLALASIIAVEPKVMILDEPTTGLHFADVRTEKSRRTEKLLK